MIEKAKERKRQQDQQSRTSLKAVLNHFIPQGGKQVETASNVTAAGLFGLLVLLLLVVLGSICKCSGTEHLIVSAGFPSDGFPHPQPGVTRRRLDRGPICFLDCRAKLNDSLLLLLLLLKPTSDVLLAALTRWLFARLPHIHTRRLFITERRVV